MYFPLDTKLLPSVSTSVHFFIWVIFSLLLLRRTRGLPMSNDGIKERWPECFKISGCAAPESMMTIEFRRCAMRCPGIHVNKHMNCTIFLWINILLYLGRIYLKLFILENNAKIYSNLNNMTHIFPSCLFNVFFPNVIQVHIFGSLRREKRTE